MVALELVLRLVVNLSVDYLSHREDVNYEYKLWQMHLFDSFMGMQEADADLFWRLKPGYRSSFVQVNRLGLPGPEVQSRRANEYRILFLGDSTPLGLGLPQSSGSFVWKVMDLLQKEMPERKVVVINGAVAGYTSWQCRRFLDLRGEELRPDLVVTYFGNNDPSYNGYLSDRQLSELAGRRSWLNDILGKSYGYQLLKGLILRLRDRESGVPALKTRVSVDEFRENLEAIKTTCERINSKLMVCSIPTPYLWPPGIQFKVFAGGKDSAGRLLMDESMRSDLNSQWDLCLDTTLLPGVSDLWTRRVYGAVNRNALSTESETKLLYEMLARTPSDPRLLNNLGVSLWREAHDSAQYFAFALAADSIAPAAWYNLGILTYRMERDSAMRCLSRARELDNQSLRIKESYNQAIRDFGTAAAVPAIDLEHALDELPENLYYVDHCHPTSRGHDLIAGLVSKAILSLPR